MRQRTDEHTSPLVFVSFVVRYRTERPGGAQRQRSAAGAAIGASAAEPGAAWPLAAGGVSKGGIWVVT